ncbi:class I SAM-dependent methyltransferase [Mycolicibacterium wolinskyi]|uniref:class I SAM-dependent methyltransferase n=1 Tax=Mycolicibacterium wolinskyi TaxID=59750 RepID=UPI000A15A1EC|nr:SAM-dependent methyltransferase [Mycolicibacterium wolinskyi]
MIAVSRLYRFHLTCGKDICGEEPPLPISCVASPAAPPLLDKYLIKAVESGIRQVIFLASDLDPRPYVLPWPAGTTVYVVDEPAILDVKTEALADARPTADLRPVPADLDRGWTTELVKAGYRADQPTIWSVEGLLPYLPFDEQRRMVVDITALSAAGSRLVTEMSANPFTGFEQCRADKDWRDFADVDMIVKWQWRFAAGQYVTAHLPSERPTSEHEAVEAVLDSVAHYRGGGRRGIHRHAGTHLLRRRRWDRDRQR